MGIGLLLAFDHPTSNSLSLINSSPLSSELRSWSLSELLILSQPILVTTHAHLSSLPEKLPPTLTNHCIRNLLTTMPREIEDNATFFHQLQFVTPTTINENMRAKVPIVNISYINKKNVKACISRICMWPYVVCFV